MLHKNKLISEWVIFYTVVECGSLSLAAKKLGTSVSTVSKSLSKMESLLGSNLLRRSPRGIEITHSGHFAYKKAKSIVSSVYSLLSEIGNDADKICGRIRLSAPSIVCENIANQWVHEYISQHADVSVDLFSRERSDLSVSSPEFDDIVLKSGFINSPDLVHCKLTPMPLVICASPDYIKKHGEITHPRDLEKHNILLLNHPSLREVTFIKTGVCEPFSVKVHSNFISNNVPAIVNLSLSGAGVCLASPYWFVQDDINSGKLSLIMPDWKIPMLDVYLVWRYREYQSPLMFDFREYIKKKWEGLPSLKLAQ